MNVILAIQLIQRKFAEAGNPVIIPLQHGAFTATVAEDGIRVDNLGNQPFLPWAVFQEAICTLMRNSGRAMRGNAMEARLAERDLSLDSIEGHVAYVVYGKQTGDRVFRRIAPIAGILIWAGLCEAAPRALILREIE
jgi:hypothetical protein